MYGSTRSCSPSLVVVTILGIILVLLPLGTEGFAQSEEDHRAWLRALDSLSNERMLADVTTLSSSSFNGRQTGTTDDASSAKWIADRFLASGLSLTSTRVDPTGPLVPGRRRDWIYDQNSHSTENCTGPLAPHFDSQRLATKQLRLLSPIFDSPSLSSRADCVCRYGIVDPTHGIDDYAGIDTTNAIVLFLRGKPMYYKGTISHADKVGLARQRGRSGISQPQAQCSAPMKYGARQENQCLLWTLPLQKHSQEPGSVPPGRTDPRRSRSRTTKPAA
jgi:hypothetical protein